MLVANVIVAEVPVVKVMRLVVAGVGVIVSEYSTLLHGLDAIIVVT